MKIFNSIEKLWAYCELCPICQSNRRIILEVGPEENYKLLDFVRVNDALIIRCDFYSKYKQDFYSKYKQYYGGVATYTINCINNTYRIEISDDWINNTYRIEISDDRYIRPHPMYFYLNVDCQQCHFSSASTTDFEMTWNGSTLSSYESSTIDQEDLYLVRGNSGFHVTLQHNQSNMIVSKLQYDSSFTILDEGIEGRYPLVNLDLSDIDKAIHRLKTIIVFS